MNVTNRESIGHGGTKTALLYDVNTVVVIPNSVDKATLLAQWPRIVEEEVRMSELMRKFAVPALDLVRCNVLHNEVILPSYKSKPFIQYAKDDIYIVDRKCLGSTTWPHDDSKSFFTDECKNPYDLAMWLRILQPLIRDVQTLVTHGISLAEDSLNIAIVGRKSAWYECIVHPEEVPYQVRLFAFDFASKYHTLSFETDMDAARQNREFMIGSVIELALWEALAPRSIFFSDKLKPLLNELVFAVDWNDPLFKSR